MCDSMFIFQIADGIKKNFMKFIPVILQPLTSKFPKRVAKTKQTHDHFN